MSFKSFDPNRCFECVTEELWEYVVERDSGLCQIYGGQGDHLHHVVRKTRGGDNCANNLILLSHKAHREEHQKPKQIDFYQKIISKNEKRFRKNMV